MVGEVLDASLEDLEVVQVYLLDLMEILKALSEFGNTHACYPRIS